MLRLGLFPIGDLDIFGPEHFTKILSIALMSRNDEYFCFRVVSPGLLKSFAFANECHIKHMSERGR